VSQRSNAIFQMRKELMIRIVLMAMLQKILQSGLGDQGGLCDSNNNRHSGLQMGVCGLTDIVPGIYLQM